MGGRGADFDEGVLTRRFVIGRLFQPLGMTLASKWSNPNHNVSSGYKRNCQRCVIAYELNRRGYRVEALPNEKNDGFNNRNNPKGYLSCFKGAIDRGVLVNKSTKSAIIDIENIMAKYGDGARAFLRYSKGKGIGHVICVERRKGKTYFIDPQINDVDSGKVRERVEKNVANGGMTIYRVDDLKITDNVKNAVKKRGVKR